MPWNLAGSYFETCSCDVICPCTASLSLGATNDRCKVVLVFNVRDGQVDGTDVSGLTVAAVCDTPKVMSEGNWRLASSSTGRHPTSRRRSSAACSRGRLVVRWRLWGRWSGRVLGSSACRSRFTRMGSSTRFDRRRDRLRD